MIAKRNQLFKLTSAVLACAVISACSSDNSGVSLNSGTPSSGDADFSKFVSIGDSLTAGFADGALYLLGQQNSYPATLAKQFSEVGGGAFEQPLVPDNTGGLVFDGNPIPDPTPDVTPDPAKLIENAFDNRLVLNTNPNPAVEGERPSPERLVGTATTEINGSGLNGTVFNNMGVPGAKSFHLLTPGYGDVANIDKDNSSLSNANPYFVRFSSTPATTVIADAAGQQPSFFVLWIGNNDVLSFATSGGFDAAQDVSAIDQTGLGNPLSAYGSNDITDPTAFAGVYAGLVSALTANPATKGVLINIPDVSTIPFFTTVPFNPVPLDQASAAGLNGAFSAYNAGVQSLVGIAGLTQEEADARTIAFVEGQQNALLILDESLTDLTVINPPSTLPLIKMRQATANDLVILPTSAIIGELVDPNDDPLDPASPRWGVSSPLTDADVLTATEIQEIDTARLAYNLTIKAAADADANLIFLDAAAIMAELQASGIDFGTGSVNSTFATGGAFGLDGVHPTGRGYAVIANAIIDAINTGFNANVHKVDPAGFPTIFLK